MSATNKTTNYDLPLFVGTDRPSWLVDFNGAMTAIDTAIYAAKTQSDTAKNTADNANAASTSAVETANAATETANAATQSAQNAVAIANNANTQAGDAKTDAHAALEKSNEMASKLKTNFVLIRHSDKPSCFANTYKSDFLTLFKYDYYSTINDNSTAVTDMETFYKINIGEVDGNIFNLSTISDSAITGVISLGASLFIDSVSNKTYILSLCLYFNGTKTKIDFVITKASYNEIGSNKLNSSGMVAYMPSGVITDITAN